jgi:hypothetical protein
MDQNPCQEPPSPTVRDSHEAVTLTRHLRKIGEARRRWSRRCWLFGGVAVFVGLAGYNLSQYIYATRGDGWLVALIGVIAICLIVGGSVLIAIGPIAWFWVRKKR